MSNFTFLLFLNKYADQQSTNNPSQNNFKWTREITSLPVGVGTSQEFDLAPGETRTLFNGTRTLNQDNTTTYNLSLKPLSSNTYILAHNSGTAPDFRTPRTTGADATTKVNVTLNGPVATFSAPVVAAVAASFTGQIAGMTTNVTITADTAGTAGNSVSLPADGISDIATLISNWNTANPGNTVTLTSGDGTQIPTSGSIALSGGTNATTPFNLIAGGVVAGDYVRIGDEFNIGNQGEWKILSVTATSFSIENELGFAEGPITLGSGFASQVQIYSAAGVQIGDTLVISGGFSPVTQGSYKVTSVGAEFLEFYSTDVLPQETNVMTQVALYSNAKQLVYLESDQKVSMILNNVSGNEIEPFVVGTSKERGMFLRKSTIYSMSVTNSGTDTAKLFFACIE